MPVVKSGWRVLRIFLSYANADQQYAEAVEDVLDRKGFEVVTDRSIQAGANWINQVIETIENCDAVVALVSDNFNQSEWAQFETAAAVDSNKRLLPIVVDDAKPTGVIGYFNHLDGTGPEFEVAEQAAKVLGDWSP